MQRFKDENYKWSNAFSGILLAFGIIFFIDLVKYTDSYNLLIFSSSLGLLFACMVFSGAVVLFLKVLKVTYTKFAFVIFTYIFLTMSVLGQAGFKLSDLGGNSSESTPREFSKTATTVKSEVPVKLVNQEKPTATENKAFFRIDATTQEPTPHLLHGNNFFYLGTEFRKVPDIFNLTGAEATHFNAGLFMGYAIGVADTAKYTLYCPPDGFVLQQAIEIVENYLKAVPERRHLGAARLVAEALSEKYPCKRD